MIHASPAMSFEQATPNNPQNERQYGAAWMQTETGFASGMKFAPTDEWV
jgi:hypothetical protein